MLRAATNKSAGRTGEEIRPGGTATWLCTPGFPPAMIFPLTPPERFGARSLYEFQVLMYRPLYWYGTDGTPAVDEELSLAELPQWTADGRTARIRLKPCRWSNGEPVDADGVMFWMHLLEVRKSRYGGYVPGYFPDNLDSYRKVSDDTVEFIFDSVYSQHWALMNQFSLITPLPKAWDRTAEGPADATHDKGDCAAVYDYLMAANGDPLDEDNAHRGTWATSPVWSVVNGPWRLRDFSADGVVSMVPNDAYSGPNKPHLDEFRLMPTASDEEGYALLERGPDGPDGAYIGFLPYGYIEEPTTDPTKGGPNPLDERYRLVPQTLYAIHYFPYNFNNPTIAATLYKQLYVRQAMQSAMDQESAVRDVYQGYGYSTNGPVPTLPASDLVSPRQRQNPYPFDLDRARDLLASHGWDVSSTPAVCLDPARAGADIPVGTPLSFELRYASGHRALTQIMTKFKADAAQVGIELNLSEIHPSVLVGEDSTCVPCEETPCRWQLSCWNGGWVYGPNFHPTGELLYRTGAGCNFGSYTDPRADELIARTVRGDDLADLYAYQDYIAEQVPVVWTPNFPLRLFEVAHELQGFEPVNPLGLINPENWYFTTPR